MANKNKKNLNEDGTLNVYSYNPQTGEFIGVEKAYPNPLEPGKFLVPAFATEVEPPKADYDKVRKWKDDKWVLEDAPQPTDEPPVVDTEEQKAAAARYRRNSLLDASDWMVLSDVPSKHKAGWEAYRQALRDVPQQEGFPENIEWPVEPK